jgi:hypothetical protein
VCRSLEHTLLQNMVWRVCQSRCGGNSCSTGSM